MADDRKMLVVDDEEVVCQACRRIFSRQGFQVETYTDARQGLVKATEKDYAIILLDIKMPNMDGIQFLERLREKKPDVPVLIITGYPSIPNAAAAMRLGACDYVTKPFTSEEVTWGVQRVLNMQHVLSDEGETVAEEREAVVDRDGQHRDALLGRVLGAACRRRVGAGGGGAAGPARGLDHGHPHAADRRSGLPGPAAGRGQCGRQAMLVVPSPISGVVAEVNALVAQRPQLLASSPCGEGWIACICATRHEEMANCKPRRILLVNADPARPRSRRGNSAALGCQVEKAPNRGGALGRLGRKRRPRGLPGRRLAGRRRSGPGRAHQPAGPHARIVVVVDARAPAGGAREAAYRKHKIFYYAVEPFADNEIADILMGVFQAREVQPRQDRQPKGPSEPISSISITNRNLHKVQLLAAPGCSGATRAGHADRPEAAGPDVAGGGHARRNVTHARQHPQDGREACDRVMVLLARDSGLLPGGLARDTKPEFDVEPGRPHAAGKVAMLTVQPDTLGGFACLDARTIAALADHIVWDMASY